MLQNQWDLLFHVFKYILYNKVWIAWMTVIKNSKVVTIKSKTKLMVSVELQVVDAAVVVEVVVTDPVEITELM